MEAIIALEEASKHYVYADYLNFLDDERVEIIKGKLFKMSPAPLFMHQIISRNISGLFSLITELS